MKGEVGVGVVMVRVEVGVGVVMVYNVSFGGIICQMRVQSVEWGYNVSNGGIMCQMRV